MNLKKIFSGAAIGLSALFGTTTIAIAATTVVNPLNTGGWVFALESGAGSGALVNGPGTTPLGMGSANLVVSDSVGGSILYNPIYQDLKLSEIDTLEYSTYRTAGGPALAIALQLNFDGNLTDDVDSWQGRLVYEPYHTQTVNSGEWQTWDTLNDSAGLGTGNWWFSNAGHAASSTCTMANPCTWSEVKTAFPNGGIHKTLGAIIFKAGSGWTGGFNGNVDALRVNEDIYDFEAYPRSASILSPTSGQDVFGMVNFTAFLNDDDADPIQWAVRQGTCTAGVGTVFGNVDGKSDPATLDQSTLSNQTFSFTGDMSGLDLGSYCFIYNPVEDAGEANIRETVQFNLVAAPTPTPEPTVAPTPVPLTDKEQCKKGGWLTYLFKNQGACVSYLQSNDNAGKRD